MKLMLLRWAWLFLAVNCWAAPPRLLLWAWERPGDLRALPAGAGVAFLAASVFLEEKSVRAVPRFQPLHLPRGVYRMGVVRIESGPSAGVLTAGQRRGAAKAIADAVKATKVQALQIDFDARVSQRAFYAQLLRDVRKLVGPDVFLSMTALVSWCEADSWLEKMPVDEVVPMLFEMGSSGPATATWLRSGGRMRSPVCQGSVGVSLREMPLSAQAAKRIYVFAYENWTEPLVRSVVARFP